MKTHPSKRVPFSVLLILLFVACRLTAQVDPIFQEIYSFPAPPANRSPGALVEGSDGNFYGATQEGYGNILRVTPSGTVKILVSFNYTNGYSPDRLVQGSDGDFYGTTGAGGAFGPYPGFGTVFKMSASGTLMTLVSFNGTNGSSPSGLLAGNDGNFYGRTSSGGDAGKGTVFKMTPSGALTTLFSITETNGAYLQHGGLSVVGPDGNFYGIRHPNEYPIVGHILKTTPSGTVTTLASIPGDFTDLLAGSDGDFYGIARIFDVRYDAHGSIFKLTLSGTLTKLVSFDGTNGSMPNSLLEGNDGNFYGTTAQGGASNFGTVFRMTRSGALTTLISFNSTDGASPGALIQGSDENFYGLMSSGISLPPGEAVFKLTPSGTLTTLVSFNYISTIGTGLAAGLVQGSDGNFYGTTLGGGASGYGDVFKVTPSGTRTTLFSFDVTNAGYDSALLQGSDGNFYGTSFHGGIRGPPVGNSIFRVTPSGIFTNLAFINVTNGYHPGDLVQASDGNFYGTLRAGGISDNGAVFKMTPTGTLTTLVLFKGANGKVPNARLVQDSDGNFYGTTEEGGAFGRGTVFKMSLSGDLTTLVSFNGTNGANPEAGLVQGSDSNLYGTTLYGGDSEGYYGTVFKMTPSGMLTTLISFNGTNGAAPYSALVRGSDGNFYGTTSEGGTACYSLQQRGYGTLFQLTPSGILTTLVSYNGTNDSTHISDLVQSKDGNVYGTTDAGIFRIQIPPTLKSFSQSGGNFALTWSAFPNRNYQVQFTTNLSVSGWQNLGGVVPATNSVMTITDMNRGPQIFYRVGLVR